MNTIIVSGNLARDPDIRTTRSGKSVARMSIAVNRPFSKEDVADFFDLVAWDKRADFCKKYLAKGRRILVEGRLQNSNYEKDGVKHYAQVIVVDSIEFADSKRKEKDAEPEYSPAEPEHSHIEPEDSHDETEIDEFDLPF